MPHSVLSDSGPSLHNVYAYLTGLLLALVGMKYQGLNTSPFKQHPDLIILFLIAITVYVMALLLLSSNLISQQHSSGLRMVLVWVCHVYGIVACELLLLLLISPLWSFFINVSSLVLLLALLFCYYYLFLPSQKEEEQAAETRGPEAATTPHHTIQINFTH